jgi:hypothetical protein
VKGKRESTESWSRACTFQRPPSTPVHTCVHPCARSTLSTQGCSEADLNSPSWWMMSTFASHRVMTESTGALPVPPVCHVARHTTPICSLLLTLQQHTVVFRRALSRHPHLAPHHLRATHVRHLKRESLTAPASRQLCVCVICVVQRLLASVDGRCLTSCCCQLCVCVSVCHVRTTFVCIC